MKFLSGYKTYIAAAGFVCLAAYHFIDGDQAKATEYIMLALGVFGLRSAVSRVADDVKKAESKPPGVLP